MLKRLRERKSLSQTAVASFLNMTLAGYNGYEIGKSKPPYETLIKLAELYNVSTDFMLERKPADVRTFGESDIVVEVLNNFKNLSPEKQGQFAQYLKIELHNEYAFFSALLENIQALSPKQQQQVAEYIRLLKLDNTVNHQPPKKRSMKPKSTAPMIAAFGGGVHEMDLQKQTELATYKKSLKDNKKE